MKLSINNQQLSTDNIIANWPSQLDGHLHYCIGLSGGIDSVVLLYLFHEIQKIKPIKLSAIHINHGISPNAKFWADFCIKICQNLKIDLKLSEVNVIKIGGEGLENSARKLRYQEYYHDEADVIILAHHQDDQIETMLSQIMRGSDLHNCAGMQKITTRKHKIFWRPLLDIKKSDLIKYANKNNLNHIEDESNLDIKYLRNFIRNKLMLELNIFDNNIESKLIRSIENIQYHVVLSDELGEDDYNSCNDYGKLNKKKFLELSQNRQLNLLSYMIKLSDLPLPSRNKLSEFCRQIKTAALDRHPSLAITNLLSLRLEKQYIFITEIKV
ncbi:MAG: tRNA lysidine(34) synthetase TilS [Burkholderiales bacterium]|nr:tRNA lysidine(34) synthetase TilS [Burkholderiales bacterium]